MAPPPSTAVTPMPRPCACGESCTANRPCHCCLAAEVEALRAQVQRVRELRDRFRDHEKWASYRNVETLLTRALDGDA
jgi:hypothetical protein